MKKALGVLLLSVCLAGCGSNAPVGPPQPQWKLVIHVYPKFIGIDLTSDWRAANIGRRPLGLTDCKWDALFLIGRT
jgi:hypothetical protein